MQAPAMSEVSANPSVEAVPDFNAPFTPWQRGVARILRHVPFKDVFVQVSRPLASKRTQPEFLLEALLNHFSLRNNGFGANHWTFDDHGIRFVVDHHGIRFEPAIASDEVAGSNDPAALMALSATHALAATVPQSMWRLTFLAPHPLAAQLP
jgi:hypothetical protein